MLYSKHLFLGKMGIDGLAGNKSVLYNPAVLNLISCHLAIYRAHNFWRDRASGGGECMYPFVLVLPSRSSIILIFYVISVQKLYGNIQIQIVTVAKTIAAVEA